MSPAARLRGWFAPLVLVAARARRRPGRWLPPALGIALAAAFVVAVAAESQIAGDQSARAVLGAASPLDSQVRVTWQGPVSPNAGDLGSGGWRQAVRLIWPWCDVAYRHGNGGPVRRVSTKISPF